jgi:signal transduction histidine kinase
MSTVGVVTPLSDRATASRHGVSRVLATGVAAALLIWLGGFVLGRARLGAGDAETMAVVQRDVIARFEAQSTELRILAGQLATPRDRLIAAASEESAVRDLFDLAAAALLERDQSSLAITIYGAGHAPLAWAGRPSELPDERIAGPRALFVAPGPLGPRLVHVEPIVDGASRRVATIVAERVLAPPERSARLVRDEFLLESAPVPVALRTRYEGAGDVVDPASSFVIPAPNGEPLLEARVSPNDLSAARRVWRRTVNRWALVALTITLLVLCGALLERRARARITVGSYGRNAAALALILVVARWSFWIVTPRGGDTLPVFSADAYSSALLGPLLASPIDLLLTGLLAAGLVALLVDALERRRLARRGARRRSTLALVLLQVAVTTCGVSALVGLARLVDDTLTNSRVDVLRFSMRPWDAARLTMDVGLVLASAAIVWLTVALFRYAAPVRLSRQGLAILVRAATATVLVALIVERGYHVPVMPAAFMIAACLALAGVSQGALVRFRRATQAVRLVSRLLLLVIPALLIYPTLFHFADEAKRRLIETQYAPQAVNQGAELRQHLSRSLAQIDGVPQLADLVEVAAGSVPDQVTTDAAFAVWSLTDLARFRLTSAVELYASDGRLVSRFALNLPEEAALDSWRAPSCRWDVYGEVSPFGAEDRRVLHAGRGLCTGSARGAARAGAIVVHAMLDYNALPFISSQSPYFEVFRSTQPPTLERLPGGDLEFVAYGWSRMPLYASAGTAWTLDDALFMRLSSSRTPFWATVDHSGVPYTVYLLNERPGIYAFGYPAITIFGHLVNLAELVTLAALGYILLAVGAWLFAALAGRRATSGRALLREIRASFYRKLFLAFVAAAVVPVVTMALLTRTYIATQLRDGIESAAVRTVAVARRVVEDYATQQQRGTLPLVADDVLVWISRVIDQDVNIFEGSQLQATSERDLFASGLLPTRTPANVYRAIALEHLPSFVGDERVGLSEYLVAAAPVRSGNREAILTIPLTLRQQEIEREIDDLDRRVLLAALIFILVGAVMGYSMAERIADPVNRLTRATRRIARGDLDARVAAMSSDELRRLVEAFNSMAADLARQRQQLERTHRLEAWAEMARQVAHEIKNPLTPIQLSAEHLQRVHVDRGRPLSPVIEECLGTILAQVRLLRQIAGEFSSFASSPTSRPAAHQLGALVAEVVEPYRTGVSERVAISIDVPPGVPPIFADRTLVGRALTNVIDNALHAMPGGGSLSIAAREDPARQVIVLTVTDSGVGMDEEGLMHIFEPYFSTKATGTGLGLTIARRNIELSGGRIAVESEKGRGTIVRFELPIAAARLG